MRALRLAILGSTRGTDMLALIAAIQEKQLYASIEIVISDRAQAPILKRAEENGLQAVFLNPDNQTREEFDAEISAILRAKRIDLIILIGYMRILSAPFVRQWKNKIINIHPSLLPAFAGSMDQNVHEAVLAAKLRETGCTIHYVTEQVDQGPILIQKKCAVLAHDTVESLKARVQMLEGLALVEALSLHQNIHQSENREELIQ
jgi:phosphoribosylglycinamide formyltransferase-1